MWSYLVDAATYFSKWCMYCSLSVTMLTIKPLPYMHSNSPKQCTGWNVHYTIAFDPAQARCNCCSLMPSPYMYLFPGRLHACPCRYLSLYMYILYVVYVCVSCFHLARNTYIQVHSIHCMFMQMHGHWHLHM